MKDCKSLISGSLSHNSISAIFQLVTGRISMCMSWVHRPLGDILTAGSLSKALLKSDILFGYLLFIILKNCGKSAAIPQKMSRQNTGTSGFKRAVDMFHLVITRSASSSATGIRRGGLAKREEESISRVRSAALRAGRCAAPSNLRRLRRGLARKWKEL